MTTGELRERLDGLDLKAKVVVFRETDDEMQLFEVTDAGLNTGTPIWDRRTGKLGFRFGSQGPAKWFFISIQEARDEAGRGGNRLQDSGDAQFPSQEKPGSSAPADEIQTILERWFEEVWNKGNAAAIDELMAADVVIHDLSGGDGEKIFDLPAFKRMFLGLRSELSAVQLTIEHTLTQGNMAAARCAVCAIYRGKELGEVPRVRPIHFTGMALVRVDRGRIVECWNHFDFETMYQQME
ncbi:MAG: ester cyclase [Acidobacteriaceae bacterium]